MISGNTLLTVACEYCRCAPSDFVCHAGLAIRQPPCSITPRHRGESATKTIKFFVAHTVNYVLCNNHTRIDWVLLNFTLVIQQNYHQPGRKFEKLFCAVGRLSCQLELSKSETSKFRSELVFDNIVLSSDFCVAEILWARNVPESSRCWQHFYAVFTSTERYFVPLPWRFLTQPELQQGSDRLNCNQKHVLMWYATKN